MFARASQQEPGTDGVRRTRWAIIRNTYPELKATTIKTWTAWFPEDKFGRVKYDSPISQHIQIDDIDLEIYFLSLDKPKDLKKLKSFELTGVYINELQFIDEDLFLTCIERTNRYPAKKEGVAPTWTGVIADANPPSSMHWIYNTFEKNKPHNFKLFRYEAALLRVEGPQNDRKYATSRDGSYYINNPNADYVDIQNDPDYWLKLVPSLTDDKINVNLCGNYGTISDGKPVHPSFNDRMHYVDKEFEYVPQVELGLGWDFGLTPAVAIVQFTPRGRMIVLDEIYALHMGLRQFVKNVVLPHLNQFYVGWKDNYASRHDPAGDTGAQTDEQSCKDILRQEGIISEAAADNNGATLRRDALDFFLGNMSDGMPAFAVSRKAQMIREGLGGQYQHARVQVGGEARYSPQPLKNLHSHICEGLEYICIKYSGLAPKKVELKTPVNRIHKGSFMAR
ncbi:MAG: hypothetical protein ACYC0J_10490 [Gammaproteobacteria bacterium]